LTRRRLEKRLDYRPNEDIKKLIAIGHAGIPERGVGIPRALDFEVFFVSSRQIPMVSDRFASTASSQIDKERGYVWEPGWFIAEFLEHRRRLVPQRNGWD
jgi:hypothetical protein